jgi:hypothetical protein
VFAYLLMGLGAALLISTGIAGCEHKAKVAAQQETKAVRLEYGAFVEAVKRRGEEQEKAAADKEAKDRETLKTIQTRYRADLARRDADLKRLREHPITDPGGREVPTVTCSPEGTNAAGQELVPAAEYRALEERAYDDALRLTRLQEWVRATNHPEE